MAFRTTPRADQDLAELYRHGTLTYGLEAATNYAEGFRDVFAFLSQFPRATRERDEVSPPVRIHPYRSHLVAYRIEDEDVVVVRILHQRSAWTEEL